MALDIKVVGHIITVDGKYHSKIPKGVNVDTLILGALRFYNADGDVEYQLTINGVDDTEGFKSRIKLNVFQNESKLEFYKYANIDY